MTKRLRGGSSPLKQEKYKSRFARIETTTTKGKTNKKHKKGRK